jgi:hypothetical protein
VKSLPRGSPHTFIRIWQYICPGKFCASLIAPPCPAPAYLKDAIYLLFQLLITLAKLLPPSGSRTVIAENLILKQQLIIHSRSRQKAPNLSTQDRALLGFCSLFLNPRRIARSAIIIKPSTLLRFHNALKKRKYRLLFSLGNNPTHSTSRTPFHSLQGFAIAGLASGSSG